MSAAQTKLARGYKAMVWINKARNYRVYLDLDEEETKWLRGIAAEFDLTINRFVKLFHKNTLPKPTGYPHGQSHEPSASELAMFKITCTNPKVWRQLTAIAKFNKNKAGAAGECASTILGTLSMYYEDAVFSPKTGEMLCDHNEVDDLLFKADGPEEPPQYPSGRTTRGCSIGHWSSVREEKVAT